MIGVELDCPFTPAMLKKVAYAGVQLASFVQATGDLEALAEVKVSRERVQRWTKRIGNQRVAQIKEQAEAYQELSLPDRGRSPVDQVPQVACVQMDGGRIQIRDRQENSDDRIGRPEVLVRSVVATREGIDAFGKRLVAAAHACGFNAAKRKAFVADGLATNWSVHRQHFSHYTPILDFTHAVCYVYAAALAGQSLGNGWRKYCQWAQWLWEGAIDQLIAAVKARSEELGPPPDGDETSSAAVVARTLGYLGNQRPRMKYDEYRKLGLSPAILSQPSSRSTAV